MKPLIILLVTFIIVLFISKLTGTGIYRFQESGTIAFSIMLLFTAMAHFKFTDGMIAMIPKFMPAKQFIVFVTGIIEILFALALLFPPIRTIVGWLLIVFLLFILPANIAAAINHVNLELPEAKGPGPSYLWFRIPLQLFFIGWIYFFSIAKW